MTDLNSGISMDVVRIQIKPFQIALTNWFDKHSLTGHFGKMIFGDVCKSMHGIDGIACTFQV